MLLADEPVSQSTSCRPPRSSISSARSFATVVVALHDVALALAWTTRVIASPTAASVRPPTAGLEPARRLAPLYAA